MDPPMTNQTTDNFIAALEAWKPGAEQPVFYRLYYDSNGFPVTYSMENLPGQYIEIDQNTYNKNSFHVRVVNGKIQNLRHETFFSKLVPDNHKGTKCHIDDVTIVVNSREHKKWRKTVYES